jgi:DNA-binding transcriptional MerR regulator
MAFQFKTWYEENSAELNQARKAKYANDPEYREKVLKANREAREKRRKERQVEKKAEKDATKVRTGVRPWKQFEVEMPGENGTMTKLFTVGALAHAIGKSVQTVRLWEKQDIIPETELRSPKGDRLYTAEQVEMIYGLLKKQGKLEEGKVRRRYTPKGFERMVQFLDGRQERLRMFRVGVLARAVDRTVVTVEQMEQKGILPVTPFRYSQTGYRLYTVEMIDVVRHAMEAHLEDTQNETLVKAFKAAVLSGWNELGVLDAKIIPEPKPQEVADGAAGVEEAGGEESREVG